MKKPSTETIKRLLDYNPKTGKLLWKARVLSDFLHTKFPRRNLNYFNKNFAGKEAFTAAHNTGGLQSNILGYQCVAHRIAWEIFYGEIPEEIIAIDGNLKNIKINNLKNSTRQAIGKTDVMFSDNTSGFRRVSWDASRNLWKAEIKSNGKKYFLGRFKNKMSAVAARKHAEERFNWKTKEELHSR